jgi:hypothetical protein
MKRGWTYIGSGEASLLLKYGFQPPPHRGDITRLVGSDSPVISKIAVIKPQFEFDGVMVDVLPECRRYLELLETFLPVFESD